MVTIRFMFPAGRYHANPWGRNVNEGVAEWPPSPYRLARALIDVCHRRRPDWADSRLKAVLEVLSHPLGFQLPPVAASHSRSYLSANKKDPTSKQKIFDGFIVVDKHQSLLAFFEGNIDSSLRSDMAELLGELNYLGRSESWVIAQLEDNNHIEKANCCPVTSENDLSMQDVVRVACLREETEYLSEENQGKKNTLTWLQAISLSTGELLKAGWSHPPAQKSVKFQLPKKAISVEPRIRRMDLKSQFRLAEFNLHTTVLPRIIDTVPIAERIRAKLMGIHRQIMGGDPRDVSPCFSGNTSEGKPAVGHKHVFILPMDTTGDGRIDKLVIKAAEPFDSSELEALDKLRSIYQLKGQPDISLILVSLLANSNNDKAISWQSATPFVTARHHRKGRGEYSEWLAREIDRECHIHDLPETKSIEWIQGTRQGGHSIRWIEFIRSRKGRRPLQGHGCILTFNEPVSGPFVLGALSHYGLGLFTPLKE